MLGSYQADALQNIAGSFQIRNVANSAGDGADSITASESGAVNAVNDGNDSFTVSYREPKVTAKNRIISLDASRVARTSIETRAANVALAPRIIAF